MSELPDIPEALTRKVGPLPVGGWLLATLAGVGVAVAVRRREIATTDPEATTLGEAEPTAWAQGASNSTQPGAGNLWAAPSNPSSTAPDANTITEPKPTTNEAWSALAARRLMAKGYQPLLVDAALRDYLTGEPLDRSEQSVITEALIIVGPPPIPAPAPRPGGSPTPQLPQIPPPNRTDRTPPVVKTPNPPKPAPVRTHTVSRGDTLSAIAARYKVSSSALYGRNKAAIEAAALKHGRRNSGSGHWIYPGTKLVIP